MDTGIIQRKSITLGSLLRENERKIFVMLIQATKIPKWARIIRNDKHAKRWSVLASCRNSLNLWIGRITYFLSCCAMSLSAVYRLNSTMKTSVVMMWTLLIRPWAAYLTINVPVKTPINIIVNRTDSIWKNKDLNSGRSLKPWIRSLSALNIIGYIHRYRLTPYNIHHRWKGWCSYAWGI